MSGRYLLISVCCAVFFFNDTAPTEIYTLSLHDALPICRTSSLPEFGAVSSKPTRASATTRSRSEEHTSELQSLAYLVCRLLLENKNKGDGFCFGFTTQLASVS